jgi:hypothetical protein
MATEVWQCRDRFLSLHCRWFDLMGEHLQTPAGETLEYWRVEKVDSVIILPIHRQQFLLPPPIYRPGLGQATWDFPGGRVPEGHTAAATATAILQRELGIPSHAVQQLVPINPTVWAINSAFSNQCLHGFVAHLQPTLEIDRAAIGQTWPTTVAGIQALLTDLTCLQCRALLLQWSWDRLTHQGGIPEPTP